MTGKRKTMLGAVVIALATTSGCMTRMQGRRLQTSLADLRLRLEDVDKLDQTHEEQVVQLQRSPSATGAAATYFRPGVLVIIPAEWRRVSHVTN